MTTPGSLKFACSTLSILLLTAVTIQAAEDDPFKDTQISAQAVGGHVYMLTGQGGNIGLSVGEDGTLIIDDQYAPLSARILSTIDELGGEKPKLILNTHHHGDHTGGNANFGKSGTIIAHNNVRLRLLKEDSSTNASLPLVTFANRVNVHFNDDDIELIHLPHGHTDGDAVVWFTKANVLHTGDLFFAGSFPYIDVDSGGSIKGMRDNISQILGWLPEDANIIPGHGPLANKNDLKAYLAMLEYSIDYFGEQIDAGVSLEKLLKQGVDKKYASWGARFINEERWIRIVHASLNQSHP
jgi:glyoxylase-like metal-dependent hydrolase (beta-lactamase superfamily II)